MGKRIVIKIGSSTLTHSTGNLNLRRVEQLATVIADIRNAGHEVIVVSSGAVAVGIGKLGLPGRPKDMAGKQACAAVGQCELMHIYDKFFAELGYPVAQILLTRDVVDDAVRKQNVKNTLERLLELRAIPIVNENDTVSVEELEHIINFGDNDTLSAVVAELSGADLLIILSDIAGLYDGDPRKDPGARLVARVERITPEIERMASGAGSSRGTGGMATKITAAKMLEPHSIDVIIQDGREPAGIYAAVDGEPTGTLFHFSNKAE